MRRPSVVLLGVSAALAVSAGIYAYAGSVREGKAGIYGAYRCMTSCRLQSPAPDAPTLEFLRTVDRNLLKDSNYRQMSGDVLVVCNEVACVNYTRSDDPQNYFGGPQVPVNQVIQPPAGGGGGGGGEGGSGGGGGAAGGGSVAPGSGGSAGGGTVIVRPPRRER
ncbi:hypothetical protein J5226_20145 [Lysobacter sp. K5869]|uniref:hypothetical protein n=1 Tax=Lysobacter sp. K5869 TaxID=2820808 RepID=UPI001C061001|nr:hypothetical protein [Lysobacter sp. K5869]QWP75894.1 hypothetical protein J5226_20145 [Lysobacter sp. K5869]